MTILFDEFKRRNTVPLLTDKLDLISESEKEFIENFPKLIDKKVTLLYWMSNKIEKPKEHIADNHRFEWEFGKILRTTWSWYLSDFSEREDFSKAKNQSIFETFYWLVLFSRGYVQLENINTVSDYFNDVICDKKWHESFTFQKIQWFKRYFALLNWFIYQSNSDWSHRLIWAIYYNQYAKKSWLPLIDYIRWESRVIEYEWSEIDRIIEERVYFEDHFLNEELFRKYGGFNDEKSLYYNINNKEIEWIFIFLRQNKLVIEDGIDFYVEINKLIIFIESIFSRTTSFFSKPFRENVKNVELLLKDYQKKKEFLQIINV